jgi:signal transduction histidine kinase
LFDRFNAMARAVSERQSLAAHLAEQEKCAMLGRLASGMAHEVNNPLGGMLNAIDTIQAHGHDPAVLRASLEFLKRGLAGIRNVVCATLVTYKGSSDSGLLTRIDLEDLRFLVQHETSMRRLRLDWDNRITEPVAIDGPAVRQITLNLLLNGCAASPDGGLVAVTVSHRTGKLQITVADQGPGLPEDMAALLHQVAPTPTPSPESKGLGLWTTGHLVRRLGGRIDVEYPGVGTRVVVNLPVGSGEALHVAA